MKGETLDDVYCKFAINLLLDPENYILMFGIFSPCYKKAILEYIRDLYKEKKTNIAKSEEIELVKLKYRNYPELLKAVLQGLAENPSFTK